MCSWAYSGWWRLTGGNLNILGKLKSILKHNWPFKNKNNPPANNPGYATGVGVCSMCRKVIRQHLRGECAHTMRMHRDARTMHYSNMRVFRTCHMHLYIPCGLLVNSLWWRMRRGCAISDRSTDNRVVHTRAQAHAIRVCQA